MGGINEAGLIVELMQLDETPYPTPDSRPALGCLEWIQYQLDNSATVHTEANRQLVMVSFQNSPFTKQVPVSALEEIARHPESSSCRNRTGDSAKVNATTTSTQK